MVTAAAAVATAFFGYALWRSTDKLWAETKRLAGGAEDQHKTLKDSVEVAGRAADAAKRSADVAVASERAWLILDYDIAMPRLDPTGDEKFYTLTFRFRNFGKTPAIITDIARDVVYKQRPLHEPSEIKFIRVGVHETVAAGETTRDFQTKIMIGHSNIQSALNGFGSIVFIGGIKYNSVFDTECETAFCLVWLPTFNGFFADGGSAMNYRK